ncbi:MAG: EthD family reductase [Mycobacteriales bacterium]
MIKLTVLYTPPAQVDEFDAHYTSVHLPLAAALPDLLRAETSVVVATPDNSPAPYHRIAELYYADAETMGDSLASEQGRRTAADAMDIAARTGSTVTMLISSLD